LSPSARPAGWVEALRRGCRCRGGRRDAVAARRGSL